MAYLDKINNLLESTILKNTTSKILQHMGRIRNASSLEQARRWVMELIQNARDVASDQGIRIRITLTDEELWFEHTGKPFRVKDVLSIINQASSKDDSIESVGKFGTGFVTTFQLSESVRLKSVLLEADEKPVPFEITLDRSGRNDEEIQKSIGQSMTQLKRCVTEPEAYCYEEDAFNTAFIYRLRSDYEKDIAKTGILDLKNTVNEILLFSDKILEIEIVIDTAEEKKKIAYQCTEPAVSLKESVFRKDFRWKLKEGGRRKEELHRLVYITKGNLSLAVEVDERKKVLPIPKDRARLFIDFPLIGSEQFPFPVVINDRELFPNEPRSGITLVDSERSTEAVSNKQIVDEAVSLYGEFLNYLMEEQYGALYHMITIPVWKENAELSEEWVTEHIYKTLYQCFSSKPLVETDQGKAALEDSKLAFAAAESMEEKERVYWLISAQKKYHTADYRTDWIKLLYGYLERGIRLFQIDLSCILKNIQAIVNSFSEDEAAMDWLNHLYQACMKNEKHAAEIKGNYVAIYPNQMPNSFYGSNTSRRVLNTHMDMRQDAITDEMLREISEYFLGFRDMKEYRDILVSKDFVLEDGQMIRYTDDDLAKTVGNYVSFITNNYKMDEVKEPIQIGCVKLAEWIDIQLEKDSGLAKKYFPQFCSEEGKAKLLTSKAIASINRELRDRKAENERLLQEIKELKNEMLCGRAEPLDGDGDVLFSREELEEFNGTAEEFTRIVGTAGEEYAYEILKTAFQEEDPELLQQYPFLKNSVEEAKAAAKQSHGTIEVIRPDTPNFKQPGYDILVSVKNDSGEALLRQYYEVKTHTLRSCLKNEIALSEEQMKLALRSREQYHVLKISYDTRAGSCQADDCFSHIADEIGQGKFTHLDKGYRYRIA